VDSGQRFAASAFDVSRCGNRCSLSHGRLIGKWKVFSNMLMVLPTLASKKREASERSMAVGNGYTRAMTLIAANPTKSWR